MTSALSSFPSAARTCLWSYAQCCDVLFNVRNMYNCPFLQTRTSTPLGCSSANQHPFVSPSSNCRAVVPSQMSTPRHGKSEGSSKQCSVIHSKSRQSCSFVTTCGLDLHGQVNLVQCQAAQRQKNKCRSSVRKAVEGLCTPPDDELPSRRPLILMPSKCSNPNLAPVSVQNRVPPGRVSLSSSSKGPFSRIPPHTIMHTVPASLPSET